MFSLPNIYEMSEKVLELENKELKKEIKNLKKENKILIKNLKNKPINKELFKTKYFTTSKIAITLYTLFNTRNYGICRYYILC